MKKYPAYKDSGVDWIGEIPVDWEPRKLAFLGAFLKGSGISRAELTETGVPVILYGDIYTQYDIQTKQLKKFTSEEVAQKAIAIHNGDLLLTGSGETKEDIGKCVVFLGNDKSYAGGDIIILRPNSQNSLFLSYVLNSEKARIEKAKISKGEIIVHIYSSKLRDIYVPLPPLPEQTAIAHYLDQKTAQIDTLLRQSEKIIALLQEQRSAIINQAVTKGLTHLPPELGGTLDVPLKDSGVEWIGEVPEHWEIKKIKHLSDLISKGTTPSTIGKELVDEGIRYIKAENIQGGKINEVPAFFIDDETHQLLKRSQLFENDILFVIAGATIGKSAILSYDFTPSNTNQAVAFIRPKNHENPYFILIWLQSNFIFEQMWLDAVQSAQPNLSMEKLGNFSIPYPSLDEQAAIVNYLDQKTTEIATLIQKEEQRMALLKEYRASLISEVVTGKVMVV